MDNATMRSDLSTQPSTAHDARLGAPPTLGQLAGVQAVLLLVLAGTAVVSAQLREDLVASNESPPGFTSSSATSNTPKPTAEASDKAASLLRQRTEIEYLGEAIIPSDALDRSGLNGLMLDAKAPMPHATVGSLGSGLAYTGKDDLYLAIADRGPQDGAVNYLNRFHTLRIRFDESVHRLFVEIVSTELLKSADGVVHSGRSNAIAETGRAIEDRRLDPEAIVYAPRGVASSTEPSIYTADEYGPWIDHWTMHGEHIARISPPAKFLPSEPYSTGNPSTGRQNNRGFEGLALSSDGQSLIAVLQGPLMQDGALDDKEKRTGVHVRMLELPLKNTDAKNTPREFVYTLDEPSHGLNEIIPFAPNKYLVIEKDGKEGEKARARRIYAIDLSGITDVSRIDHLPATDPLPDNAKPVQKFLLFDMLEPRFGLAGPAMPEKVEGLALGPTLTDGRRLLIIASDNDFRIAKPGAEDDKRVDQPNRFWAFAIPNSLLSE